MPELALLILALSLNYLIESSLRSLRANERAGAQRGRVVFPGLLRFKVAEPGLKPRQSDPSVQAQAPSLSF